MRVKLARRPGPGMGHKEALAWVIVANYVDVPAGRADGPLWRDLPRNTVPGGVVRVGQALTPIINLLRYQLLESDLILGDETELVSGKATNVRLISKRE